MKKNYHLLVVSISILVLFLSGCAAGIAVSEANTVAASDINLSTYKTYAWFHPVKVAPTEYEKGFSDDLDNSLRKAIEEELKRKGFQKVTLKPDVLVAYDISVPVPKEKDNPENYSDGFGYSYAHMAGYRYNYGHNDILGYRAVDLYKQGTLIIDIIDPAGSKLLWRGWNEGAIKNYKANFTKIKEEVAQVMNKLER